MIDPDIEKLFTSKGRYMPHLLKKYPEGIKALLKLTEYYPTYIPKQPNKKDKNGDIALRIKIYKENIKKEDLICSHPDCNNFVNFEYQKQKFTKYCSRECVQNHKTFPQNWKNTKDINKQFIIDNFLINDEVDINQLKEYFNMSDSACRDRLKEYNLKPKFNKHVFEHLSNNDLAEDREFIIKNFIDENNYLKLYSFRKFFGCSDTVAWKRLKNMNIDYKKQSVSHAERYIKDFIISLDPDTNIITSDRKILNNKELDIYLPDYNIAIEYNGLIFHSTGKSKYNMLNNYQDEHIKKVYHVNKTDICESKNIQLFHIYENEFKENEDIWKSVIKHSLNKIDKNNRIYARKCQVKLINKETSNSFLIDNHLQGKCISSVRLGLYYNDELYSVMTFGKSRYSKKYEYELIRFCTKLNHTVIGGASKLLKYFERNYNPQSLISYANRRWSQGKLYDTLGFEYTHTTQPNYQYLKYDEFPIKLYSRQQFQKHKLKDKLEIFDENLTETENMYNNNYRKIYDCGNKVYIKQYKKE